MLSKNTNLIFVFFEANKQNNYGSFCDWSVLKEVLRQTVDQSILNKFN